MPQSWIDFWNSGHAIYVSRRHKRLHAAAVARDIARHIPDADAVVLDFGCGEALYAQEVAAGCRRLILCEAAPRVREELGRRLAGAGNIEVIDTGGLERLAAGSIDLVVVNSVLQYLKRDELEALLPVWARLLQPTGRLVIADVIPPGVSPLTDAAALLGFALRGDFLVAAVLGLARTALSDYGSTRLKLGFAMYGEAEMIGLLARHGFAARRAHPNFGHNQARMTFVAEPRADQA